MTSLYTFINTEDDLKVYMSGGVRGSEIAFDFETTGLENDSTPLLLSLCFDSKVAVVDLREVADLDSLKPYFTDPKYIKIAHNAQFDWKVMYRCYNIYTDNVYCTLLAQKLLNAGIISADNSLAACAEEYVGVELSKEVRATFTDPNFKLSEQHIKYSAEDVRYLSTIKRRQVKRLAAVEMLDVCDLEMSVIPSTALMELQGVPINLESLDRIESECLDKIDQVNFAIENTLLDLGVVDTIYISDEGYSVVNTNSNPQVIESLNALGIDVDSLDATQLMLWDSKNKRKNKATNKFVSLDKYITDQNILKALNKLGVENNLLKMISYLKSLRTVTGTNIKGIRGGVRCYTGTPKIYSYFNQLGADTGRYSSSSPNIQNIPKNLTLQKLGIVHSLRECIEAPKGYKFIISDYSGIELLITAVLSGDDVLLGQILEGDVHTLVAQRVLGYKDITVHNKKEYPHNLWREGSKKTSYSICYGTTGKNLAEQLNLAIGLSLSKYDGEEIKQRWLDLFYKAAAFFEKTSQAVLTPAYEINGIPVGFVADSIGRRRHWPIVSGYDFGAKGLRAAYQREASNSPIQGTSASMTKYAMRFSTESLPSGADVIMCVHDEIVALTPEHLLEESKAAIKWSMEEGIRRTLPQVADYIGKYESTSANPQVSHLYDK